MEAGHFSPEMLQNANQMAMYPQGMTAPGQAPNHAAMAYGMQGHAMGQGQEVQAHGHAHGMHPAQQGYMQQHMGMQMAPDGTPMVMPYAMDGSQQNPQHAQAQQMMYQQHCAAGAQCNGGQCAAAAQCAAGQCGACQGGCPAGACQGGGCCQGCSACGGGCPAAGGGCSGCAGGCAGNCGGYVVSMPGMQGMMMPGQMNMAGQQPGQGHPGMQFVMVPGQGGAPGQMQHAMQGMPGQMQGQMQQMQGVQGGMPPQQMQGHVGPDGHPMAQPTPGQCAQMAQMDHGKGGCQGPADAGDGKGGRVAAGLGRNTQPKQGANWQQGAGRGAAGRSADARPFEPNHQEQAPAVPGEQGKGGQAGQNPQDGNQKGNKLRNPKNPWADIQDSVGLDQEMNQLWDINMRSGQMPAMDTNQKAGNFNGPSKGKGKKDGKDGGKHNDDNMGGGKGGKDMPQQKWVEKTEPQGKGQRGGWQPKDVMKQQAMQQVPMSPGGKSNSKGYQQPLMGRGMGGMGAPNPMLAQSPGPKKNKKGVGRDPEMDDWLNLRFQGQIPATPTGSTNMGGEEMWGDEEEERRKRKGAGKQGGGKGQAKGKGGNGKGKAKGGKGGGSWQRASG